MPKRTATCQDCAATFEGSAKGTLSKWCPPCREAHTKSYNKAWREANAHRMPDYPSRQYEVIRHQRGYRGRECSICGVLFMLVKGEHGDKACFFCETCRYMHGYCTTCQTIQPAEEFNENRTQTFRRKEPRCRTCRKVAYSRENRRVRVAAKYGLSLEDWEQLADSQGRRCAICKRHQDEIGKKGLVVDHCHRSGRMRALLCSGCNSGIGLLRDDADLLRAAIAYLDYHQGVNSPANA